MKTFDANYRLLEEMYQDEYYPDFLVDKVKTELQKVITLLEGGETDTDTVQDLGEKFKYCFKFNFQEDGIMGLFSKLLKGPQPDMEKSAANEKKVRALFNQVVENGKEYRLIVGYTEDVKRFNYGFVHGSKTQIGNLIVGWNEDTKTIVVVPTVPDLSGCGDPTYYRREEILKAYRNKYPTDAFIIYPDRNGYIGINAYEWLEDEKLYVYLYQKEELEAFTAFFQNSFSTK